MRAASDSPSGSRAAAASHQLCRARRHRPFATQRLLGAQRHGQVEVATDVEPGESGRRDADDLERMTAQPQRLPDRIVAAAVGTPPERVAQDRATRAAPRPVVVGRQQPAALRLKAEHPEVVAAHGQRLGKQRLARLVQVETGVGPDGQTVSSQIGAAQFGHLGGRQMRLRSR